MFALGVVKLNPLSVECVYGDAYKLIPVSPTANRAWLCASIPSKSMVVRQFSKQVSTAHGQRQLKGADIQSQGISSSPPIRVISSTRPLSAPTPNTSPAPAIVPGDTPHHHPPSYPHTRTQPGTLDRSPRTARWRCSARLGGIRPGGGREAGGGQRGARQRVQGCGRAGRRRQSMTARRGGWVSAHTRARRGRICTLGDIDIVFSGSVPEAEGGPRELHLEQKSWRVPGHSSILKNAEEEAIFNCV